MAEELQTVWWEPGAVCLIDQRRLPHVQETVRCEDLATVAWAIKAMVVRGAPAIGCTAAYGMALVAQHSPATSSSDLIGELEAAKATLDAQRPTAVNLAWATRRVLGRARASAPEGPAAVRAAALD
ncbi:MAG: S-methyl-5-thioribose-1-phosphate isomerase, partial [Chloroflexaceae bacterium]|nr:S-methyl-5-thioribose-1-phosphate isomerase [Chloroflexaceae bacterium]